MVDFNKALAGAGKAISDFGTSVSKKAQTAKAYGREICSRPTEGIKKVATDAGNASLGALKSFGKTIERDFKSLTTNHKNFELGSPADEESLQAINDQFKIAKRDKSAASANTQGTAKTGGAAAPVAPPTAKATQKADTKESKNLFDKLFGKEVNTKKPVETDAPAAPANSSTTQVTNMIGFLKTEINKNLKRLGEIKNNPEENKKELKELQDNLEGVFRISGGAERVNEVTKKIQNELPKSEDFNSTHDAVGVLKKVFRENDVQRFNDINGLATFNREESKEVNVDFARDLISKQKPDARLIIEQLSDVMQPIMEERKKAGEASITKMDAMNLATATAPNFLPRVLPPGIDEYALTDSIRYFVQFVYENHHAIFPPPAKLNPEPTITPAPAEPIGENK